MSLSVRHLRSLSDADKQEYRRRHAKVTPISTLLPLEARWELIDAALFSADHRGVNAAIKSVKAKYPQFFKDETPDVPGVRARKNSN